MNKANLYRGLVVGLVLIQLLELVVPLNLTILDACFAIGVTILGISRLSRSFQIATLIFFVAGLGLLSTTSLTLSSIATAVVSMVDIVVLLVVMQLFLIPVTVGKYQTAVEEFMQDHVHGPKQTYTFVMLVTHLLSSILSMGTVAIVLSILGDSIKRQVKDSARFSATAVTRAFTLGTLWAPGAATIFLISTVTKVSWTRLFIPCLILGLLGLGLAYTMEHHQAYMQETPTAVDQNIQRKSGARASLLELVFAVVTLLVLSFSLMENHVATSMTAVTLAGLLVVLVWTGLLRFKRGNQQSAFNPTLKKY